MSPIAAVHTLIYSDDAPATRRFLREVLQFPFVSDTPDEGDADWLIFGTGPSELGVHPTHGEHEGHTFTSPRQHQIALLCTDLPAAIADIESRGGEFLDAPRDQGFGITVMLAVPGADPIMLYEPRHTVAYDRTNPPSTATPPNTPAH